MPGTSGTQPLARGEELPKPICSVLLVYGLAPLRASAMGTEYPATEESPATPSEREPELLPANPRC